MLAGLIIVAAVTMFVGEPRKAIGVAAAFSLVAGVFWLSGRAEMRNPC